MSFQWDRNAQGSLPATHQVATRACKLSTPTFQSGDRSRDPGTCGRRSRTAVRRAAPAASPHRPDRCPRRSAGDGPDPAGTRVSPASLLAPEMESRSRYLAADKVLIAIGGWPPIVKTAKERRGM